MFTYGLAHCMFLSYHYMLFLWFPDSTKEVLLGGPLCLETRQEQAFAIHSQERIMGLLGAMIPQENKVSDTDILTDHDQMSLCRLKGDIYVLLRLWTFERVVRFE